MPLYSCIHIGKQLPRIEVLSSLRPNHFVAASNGNLYVEREMENDWLQILAMLHTKVLRQPEVATSLTNGTHVAVCATADTNSYTAVLPTKVGKAIQTLSEYCNTEPEVIRELVCRLHSGNSDGLVTLIYALSEKERRKE